MKRTFRSVLSCFLCAILLCAGAPVIQHGFPLLFTADAVNYSGTYICSDTADCYATAYTDRYGIEFRVCDGSHLPENPVTLQAQAKDLPDGTRSVWQADKKYAVKLTPSEDGMTCKIDAKWSRTVNITVKAMDADGNVICESEAAPVRSVGGIQGIFLGLGIRYICEILKQAEIGQSPLRFPWF